jgi:microfibrillar-associated protein 1
LFARVDSKIWFNSIFCIIFNQYTRYRQQRLKEEQELAARQAEIQTVTASDEDDDDEVGDESEEESTSDDEDESSGEEGGGDGGARLKPVFVRSKDRITLEERAKEEEAAKLKELEAKKMAEERRRETLRMVENDRKGCVSAS